MLREMQPFASDVDANYLGWINRLSRIDRHRRLGVMTSYLVEMTPVIGLPIGCTARLQWGDRVLGAGRTDVLRIVVSPWSDEMKVEINPKPLIDPEIEDWSTSKFWRRITYSERFTTMQVFVAGEVAVYEYDCTGATRKPDLLTTEFKTESDARRPRLGLVAKDKQATSWSTPHAGKPTSKAAFGGQQPRSSLVNLKPRDVRCGLDDDTAPVVVACTL